MVFIGAMTAKSTTISKRKVRATVSYPYHTLSTCLEIAAGVKDIGNGKKEVSRTLLASHLKLDEKSGDFAQKLASTKCYGLIDGRSDFKLTDLSMGLYFPTEDPERQRRTALLQAARNPGAFSALLEKYDGSKPPSQELMGNVLSQEMGIPESWKLRIATYFIKAMETAGAISSDGFLRHKAEMETVLSSTGQQRAPDAISGIHGHAAKKPGLAEEQRRTSLPTDDIDQEGVIVWKYPFKGKTLRIETPEDITHELWNKLKRYIEVLEPEKK